MFIRSTVLLASAALTASGLLLPPSISDKDVQSAEGIFGLLGGASNERVFLYDCPGCPSPAGKENEAASLALKFSVPSTAPNTLHVNDVEIFALNHHHRGPKLITAPLVTQTFPISELGSLLDNVDQETQNVHVGFEVFAVAMGSNTKVEVVKLNFHAIQVDGAFVNGLDTLDITVFRSPGPEGGLTLGGVGKERTAAPVSPSDQEKAGEAKECTTLPLLCKWKALVAAKINKMKSSVKHHCPNKFHPFRPNGASRPGRLPTHNHFRPHFDHRQHHRHHGAMHIIKRIVINVVFPIFVGIAAGMTASILGMIVGQFVVFAWRRLYRRGGRGTYDAVPQDENSSEEYPRDEKVALPEEDLPAYEDAVETVVVEEKREE
ncbi:MAG: hypothetical protein M4579_002863 [Chaenotheca gracillima]|nr:MAG: hypothetical protein M4579_002863 [Chaenotheca gracillima]